MSLDDAEVGAGLTVMAGIGIVHIIWPNYFIEKRWRFQGWDLKNWSAAQVRLLGIAVIGLLFSILFAARSDFAK